MCSAARWVADRTTFLVSPGYPHRYPRRRQCVCSVVTERNQRPLVRAAADSALDWTPGCRADVLAVYDGGAAEARTLLTHCGHLPLGLNVTSQSNAVLVAFRSDDRRQRSGFWLAVEGNDCRSPRCDRRYQ